MKFLIFYIINLMELKGKNLVQSGENNSSLQGHQEAAEINYCRSLKGMK